jgi:hypothetical protein
MTTQLLTNAFRTVTKEFTGFVAPENIIVTYDSTGRTITLTGTVEGYFQGQLVTSLVSGWVSSAHGTSNGSWFLYYNGTAFVWSQTPWTFDMMMIAYVYYGASDKFAIREVHGLMPWQTHKELHETVGTYFNSGGDMSGYTLASTTAAERRPSVSATVVSDEDLQSTITALADDGPYTTLTLAGTGTSTFTTGYAEIVPVLANNPYYNLFSTPNWTQVLMANNSYMSVWLVAVPASASAASQLYRYLWVQGQSNGSLASQQATTFNSLNLGQLASIATEFVPIGKVIIRYQGGNWEITSVEKITGTRVSSVTAPAGNYLSTVAVDATLTGDGTVGNPLHVVGGGGGGTTVNFGTAIIDFGTFPGTGESSIAVTGQTGILAGSVSAAFIDPVATVDHTADDHKYAAALIGLSTGDNIPGSGFTIYGRCLDKMQGTFNLKWYWS